MQIETYRPDPATETPASAPTTTHSDYYLPCHPAGSIERMRRPDLRAKKNTKPAPKVLRRQKWHKPSRVRREWQEVAV